MTDQDEAFCGNCGYYCGAVVTVNDVKLIRFKHFRITLDFPSEDFRICERVTRRLRSDAHHHITHVITAQIQSEADVERYERDFKVSKYS